MKPKISIVTPSYNQGQYIEWTIRSVVLQRYPNLEYVVMDGGSSDGTLPILKWYQRHLSYWVSEKDGGQSDAVRRGFERSSGDIMAYLNSDDVLAPGALNFVADFFERNPKIDAVYSHRCIIDEQNNVLGYWILPPHSNLLMERWDLIPQETCFWRRRLFERAGNLDSSFRFALDYDLFVRYMRAGKFRRVPRFLSAFRMHKESKTVSQLMTVGQAEISRVHQKHGIRFPKGGRLIGTAFQLSVQLRSARFARQGGLISGCLPGTGYNYDEIWGELLNCSA